MKLLFTAIGILMVSALAASAPYDTYYAPQYYYQPRPVQPYYYTPEAYAGQYVYDRQQYVPSSVVYRYARSAQLPTQSAAGPPPPPPGYAGPDLLTGQNLPDYVDYGAYTGNHGPFGWYSDHQVGSDHHY